MSVDRLGRKTCHYVSLFAFFRLLLFFRFCLFYRHRLFSLARFLPVIDVLLVASRRAAPAVFSLYEIQRQLPLAERRRLLQHLRHGAAVDRVASDAVPPFLPVYMQIMQVLFTVPEVRRKRRVGEPEQVPVVTAEAKLVFIIAISHVEVRLE